MSDGAIEAWPFNTRVAVTLPQDSSDSEILAALSTAFLDTAQAQYPGARLAPNWPVTVVGHWEADEPIDGQQTYRATLRGRLTVPGITQSEA